MQQLELRKYPRAEIAAVLSVNLKDSNHFAERVKDKLDKWGYGYDYNRRAVTIISKPETPAARLKEIVIRSFGMDIQVNAVQFACFLAAFTDIEGFATMPWEERAIVYYKRYGVWVDDRTMRGWCSQLIKRKIIAVCGESVAWKTTIVNNKKYRERLIPGEPNDMWDYYDRRSEIFAEEYELALMGTRFRGEPPAAARKEAWGETYKRLWQEFECCYYYCKCFTLSAFSEEYGADLQEMYELAQEIAEVAAEDTEARRNVLIPKDEEATQRFVF